ncbi:ketosteroid isomerase-like enzyme [Desulfocurvibacter africanus PCS]|uniref:Ketosteroid isomerase-like enzyme n=1 Tax=Desulfocurvibacter africanus PCS TaxID=1262666 RepID=M5PQX6_DESAF|nr:nuclear transport factor 2 family protein [Desulfocurvibacter africanus]EMG36450.1 ketosteroid isomerase-like enzyme [Desulfocurvibacter africanus PCS]
MRDEVKAHVWATVEAMLDAYCRRDVQATMSYFADTPELVCIGSGPREKSVGHTGLRQGLVHDFADTDAMEVACGEPLISVAGDVAWVATDCLFTVLADGETLHVKARLTAVLRRLDETWRIVQSHLSLPFPPEE